MSYQSISATFITFLSITILLCFLLLAPKPSLAESAGTTSDDISATSEDMGFYFLGLLQAEPEVVNRSLNAIKQNWDPSLISMSLELISYSRDQQVNTELMALIRSSSKQDDIVNVNDWYQWLWNEPIDLDSNYSNFKANLYFAIDYRFETYFRNRQHLAIIRLDEIRWGGVKQDGIPPLRNPKMISAKKATYLDDDNVVFGIEINGDARAYPKRILAWHEMFTDTIGGVNIAGVYCTLCGTMIPYKTEFKGEKHTLGTSGFLYRSNKLMYDKTTQSLWSTTRGVPVVGPLVDKGIELEYESVVTTTWAEWRKRHPETTVLSLDTGYSRDYGEGVAYSDYFSSNKLMFNTPFNDDRLDNKREVLALRFQAAPNQQLAIDTQFLNKNPLYKDHIGQQHFIVLTDSSGANRVYDPKEVDIVSYDKGQQAVDSEGAIWKVTEGSLLSDDGKHLARLPYHRAFWFGWQAAFPKTKLIK